MTSWMGSALTSPKPTCCTLHRKGISRGQSLLSLAGQRRQSLRRKVRAVLTQSAMMQGLRVSMHYMMVGMGPHIVCTLLVLEGQR